VCGVYDDTPSVAWRRGTVLCARARASCAVAAEYIYILTCTHYTYVGRSRAMTRESAGWGGRHMLWSCRAPGRSERGRSRGGGGGGGGHLLLFSPFLYIQSGV